jgi:hypothetical protein
MSVKEYRYPTEFNPGSGFAVPTAFEVRNIGSSMELLISSVEKESLYSVTTDISNVALNATAHYSASKADQRGSIEQPLFTTEKITTQFQLKDGVPKLVSTYSPFKDDQVEKPAQNTVFRPPSSIDSAGNVLRLVFITVKSEK